MSIQSHSQVKKRILNYLTKFYVNHKMNFNEHMDVMQPVSSQCKFHGYIPDIYRSLKDNSEIFYQSIRDSRQQHFKTSAFLLYLMPASLLVGFEMVKIGNLDTTTFLTRGLSVASSLRLQIQTGHGGQIQDSHRIGSNLWA